MAEEPSTSGNVVNLNGIGVPQINFHPWPHLKDMFEMVGTKNQSYRMRCILCQPKNHELLAFKNSPSNLKKHIQRKHANHIQEYKYRTGASMKRKSCSDEGPLCLNSCSDEGPLCLNSCSDEGPLSIKLLKLEETYSLPQKTVEDAVMNFVIQGLHPYSIVEQSGFINLVRRLQPEATVMSQASLECQVDKAVLEMKNRLRTTMSEIEFIATTTDCWTAHGRSYIGVTAHWINPDTLERCCAALACKQLKGSHTFAALAEALNDIHTQYNVREKIIRTTTDNGSNFVKALRMRGDRDESCNAEPEDLEEEAEEGETKEGEEEDAGLEVKFVEVEDMLQEDDGMEFLLPKHHRCACHLLNLVSTVDVCDTYTNTAYSAVSRSAFSKCWALWKKSARSAKAAEMIEVQGKLQLLIPNNRGWNSLFMAVERIISILREQGESSIRAMCNTLKAPMFTPAEQAFLAEYVKTMSPIVKAISVLQAEANVHMGWLVPTITLLKRKLEHLRLSCKFCLPLVDNLLLGIEKRFGQMLSDPELIAASILLPKFRTCWTNDENIHKIGLDYIQSHLMEQPTQYKHECTNSSEEEDFFSSIKQAQEGTKQLEGYLASPDDTMDILKCFPSVFQLSLKVNTALPASAACERLFSTTGPIFSPRTRLYSKNFENQALLRLNTRFWNSSYFLSFIKVDLKSLQNIGEVA